MISQNHSLYLQLKGVQGAVLSDLYFDYFDMKAFKQEVLSGDVLYMTVRKDQVGHMSARLGGLRKNRRVYFNLDKMKDAKNRSLLVLQIIFWVLLAITLFWLRLTYVIFNRKEKSLSERLTSKD